MSRRVQATQQPNGFARVPGTRPWHAVIVGLDGQVTARLCCSAPQPDQLKAIISAVPAPAASRTCPRWNRRRES